MSKGTPEAARTRAARTYNAAVDHYDDPDNTFWARFGRRENLEVLRQSGLAAVEANVIYALATR